MHKLKIKGNKKLNGEVNISGAKNSVVALIPSCILCDENIILDNIPNISDVNIIIKILDEINIKTNKLDKNKYEFNIENITNKFIKPDLTERLRASYYFIGALLGKFKHVEIGFPGGCIIGERPIDLHLKGFEKLGANIKIYDDKIILDADKLVGNNIYLDFPSVGATINIMLASVKAEGKTIIKNAAKEPEIIDIANFLNKMGAKIKGAGTNLIEIEGVNYLHSCYYKAMFDRIEAGTYIILGAACSNNLKINNVDPKYLTTPLNLLKQMGVNFTINDNNIIVLDSPNLKSINLETDVYPGFPTDLQQIIASLMTNCEGISTIKEKIFNNRFKNLNELNKMGANINIKNNIAYISGPTKLKGCTINASDLRAGAGLIVAALMADGETTIENADYILRGYEDIVLKLKNIDAEIELY